jgi:hypothetical protein
VYTTTAGDASTTLTPGVAIKYSIYQLENKSVYDMAFFNQIEVYIGVEGNVREEYKSSLRSM